MPKSASETRAFLPAKVAAALREHVPEELSIMMRTRLEEADGLIVENERLERDLSAAVDELAEHTKLANRERAVKRLEDLAAERALELDARERQLETLELKTQIGAEKRISQALEGALAGLVRNTSWRESVLDFSVNFENRQDGSSSSTYVPKETEKEAK